MLTSGIRGLTRGYLSDVITAEEVKAARMTLYSGMPIVVYNAKTECIEKTEIDTWVNRIILCENGTSFTMNEYAMYLRNKSRPLGAVWSKMPPLTLNKFENKKGE